MAHQNIQIPPDSRGKKILHRVEAVIGYENGTIIFSIGDIVTGELSGVSGDVIFVEGNTVSGTVHILLNNNSSVAFTGGESLQVSAVTNATMADGSQVNYYVPVTTISGGNTTSNQAYVDNYGALYSRFAEGNPQLDAFGRLEVSENTTLGDYVYEYDKLPNLISEVTSGSGSATYNGDVPEINMAVTDALGDAVVRTTDIYHHYIPGQGQLCEMTLWNGDSGKTGNRRRWGYFDKDNGVYFELDGTTFYVVIRSSSTGTLIETKIAQTDWNLDKLDGDADIENQSGFTLDLTKSNIFFIDFQWLGVGRVRYGVNINGQRVVVHENNFANNNTHTYMGTGTLPVRWENRNIASTSGTSELHIICSTVQTAGQFQPNASPFANDSKFTTVSTSASYAPIISGRMKETFKGKDNRKVSMPKSISVYNNGSIPVVIEMILNPILVGDTWAADIGSDAATIQDTTATSLTGGVAIGEFIVSANSSESFEFAFGLNTSTGKLFRKADITATPIHMTVAGRLLDEQTGSTQVKAFMNWSEI